MEITAVRIGTDVLQITISRQRGQGAFCNEVRLPANPPRREISELFLYTPIIQMAFLSEHRDAKAFATGERRARDPFAWSVALELCAMAAREADIFLTARSSPWDHNAARIYPRRIRRSNAHVGRGSGSD
jgi:fructose-1,6-bisphosphatase/inositol monophosphatase family enzyme